MKALVVFHGNGCHWLDCLLEPGFRHVFVAILTENGYWIELDGRAGVMYTEVMTGADFDLKSHYEELGHTVVETEQSTHPRSRPLEFTNCVGLVKAVLGIKSWAITPFQLYKYMIKE